MQLQSTPSDPSLLLDFLRTVLAGPDHMLGRTVTKTPIISMLNGISVNIKQKTYITVQKLKYITSVYSVTTHQIEERKKF